jgi:protein-S-isoprenylcysteine O-methyltransferase Ste14
MKSLHGKRKVQQQRGDLPGEHKVGDAGQILFACLFLAAWLADTFFFKYTTSLNQYVSLGIRIPVGIGLFLLSGYLARTGLSIVFGEERQTPGVIRKSVFNFIRHPVYLSEILLYLGFLMMSISLVAVVVWIIAIGFLHYISRYEEKLLLEHFGAEYEQYMREVPMWIPRLWRRQTNL